MMEIRYQSVFCYADFLGEGKEGNTLVSETIEMAGKTGPNR